MDLVSNVFDSLEAGGAEAVDGGGGGGVGKAGGKGCGTDVVGGAGVVDLVYGSEMLVRKPLNKHVLYRWPNVHCQRRCLL